MNYTKTQEVAADFARKRATAQDVVDALKSAPKGEPSWQGSTLEDYEERMQNDDVTQPNLNGWDGIVALYNTDVLTEDQFKELHSLYFQKG